MKRNYLMIPLLLVIGSSVVYAHGGTRQKVIEKIDIDATPEVVWKKLKNFGDLSWLPAVKSTKAENLPAADGKCEENAAGKRVWVAKGGDADSSKTPCGTRVLTLGDGKTITERVKEYKSKKMKISYRITDMSTVGTVKHIGKDWPLKVLPVDTYSASLTVKANKNGGSEVTWKSAFYRGFANNNPPPELNEQAAIDAVTPILQQGLANLKKVVEGK